MAAKHGISPAEYKRYINSPEWRAFRKRYKASNLPQRCTVCKGRRVHLHHLTYERFGHEELTDVMPLCELHHSYVHKGKIPEPESKIKPNPSRTEIRDDQEFKVFILPPLERGWTRYKRK